MYHFLFLVNNMPLEKKKSPYMDELLFKRFPVAEVEAELEGIKSPVFIPSEEVLDFGEGKTVSVEEAEVVYHQDETKIYELPEEQMKLPGEEEEEFEEVGEAEEEWKEEAMEEIYEHPKDFVTCPHCQTLIPIYPSTGDRVTCPSCGKRVNL